MQVLLYPEWINLKILKELNLLLLDKNKQIKQNKDALGVKMHPINPLELDLIDKLL